MADGFPEQSECDLTSLVDQKNGDQMMKQLLLNSVIAKYHDLSVSRRSVICLSLQPQQIIFDLLATDKSQYFAQPHSIIINYCTHNIFKLNIIPSTVGKGILILPQFN